MRYFIAVAIMVIGLTTPAQADAVADPPVVNFIGDSTVAYYNDTPGDPDQGWWSMSADDLGYRPILNALGGAGFIRYGAACTRGRFGSWLPNIVAGRQDVIVVDGGRNDLYECDTHGTGSHTSSPISAAETDQGIRQYLFDLAQRVDAVGFPRSSVYVMTVWGSARMDRAPATKGSASKWAKYYGFNWIGTPYLTEAQTVDGTHQNAEGNQVIRSYVTAALSQARPARSTKAQPSSKFKVARW